MVGEGSGEVTDLGRPAVSPGYAVTRPVLLPPASPVPPSSSPAFLPTRPTRGPAPLWSPTAKHLGQ